MTHKDFEFALDVLGFFLLWGLAIPFVTLFWYAVFVIIPKLRSD